MMTQKTLVIRERKYGLLKIRTFLYHRCTINKVRGPGTEQHLQTKTEEDQYAEP